MFDFLALPFYLAFVFYVWSTLLVLLNTVWLALTLVGLPGNWLIIVSTVLFAWWHRDTAPFSIATLIVIIILAIAGELLEFFAGGLGARKAGGSRRSAIGAILGAVTGTVVGTFVIPLPFFGTLIGACAGACIGALCLELTAGRDLKQAAVSGLGAGVAELLAINAKLLLGLAIWLIVAIAVFLP